MPREAPVRTDTVMRGVATRWSRSVLNSRKGTRKGSFGIDLFHWAIPSGTVVHSTNRQCLGGHNATENTRGGGLFCVILRSSSFLVEAPPRESHTQPNSGNCSTGAVGSVINRKGWVVFGTSGKTLLGGWRPILAKHPASGLGGAAPPCRSRDSRREARPPAAGPSRGAIRPKVPGATRPLEGA